MVEDKRIGIISCHASYNYGAMLQAYGLYKSLKNKGYYAEHIDFRPEKLTETYKIFQPDTSLKNIIRNFFVIFTYRKDRARADKFEQFMIDELNLSQNKYLSVEQLNNENITYTHYICGSDQIWNSNLFIDNDAYYLSFVKEGKKIAYAPSMGNSTVIPDNRLKMLLSFDSLSIREESGQKYIESTLKCECPVLIDPVFLLKKEDWDNLAGERIIKKPYLYFYTVGEHQPAFEVAKKIANKLDLDVVVSQTCGFKSPYPYGWIKRYDSGPKEFLNYIKYADFVVASSFHGTAFSIIFNTPFYSYRGNTDKK